MAEPVPASGAGFLLAVCSRSDFTGQKYKGRRAEVCAAQHGLQSDAGTQLLLSRLTMPSAKAKLISKRKQFQRRTK